MVLNELKAIEDEIATPEELKALEGNKAKIASVEEIEVPSKYNERGKNWVVRVVTEEVTTKSGKTITPSELFNLKEENARPIGFSKQGKLQNFLDRQKVEHPKDLPGTEVTLATRIKKIENGDDQTFIGFMTK